MLNNIEERFNYLDELIRKVSNLVSPFDSKSDLELMIKKDVRDRLFGKYPKCFLSLRSMGRDNPIFPICNRLGAEDPDIIKFSIKLANKLKNKPEIDGEQIDAILVKLNGLHSKFSKDPIKPANMATRKGLQTRILNNIKGYIERVRGKKE